MWMDYNNIDKINENDVGENLENGSVINLITSTKDSDINNEQTTRDLNEPEQILNTEQLNFAFNYLNKEKVSQFLLIFR